MASRMGLKLTISGPIRLSGYPQEEGEHRPLKTLFSRGTAVSWRLFVISLHPPLFVIPATGFEGPAEPISFTFALIIVAEGNLEPLYIGPRWTSEIVPGGPLNMAFDPPGPRNNPPIRDFLYRQEVVHSNRPRQPSRRVYSPVVCAVSTLKNALGMLSYHRPTQGHLWS